MEYVDVIVKCPSEYAEKVQAYAEEMVTNYLKSIKEQTAIDEYDAKIADGKAVDVVEEYNDIKVENLTAEQLDVLGDVMKG